MVDFDAELGQLVFTYSTADGSYHRDRIHPMSDGYRGTLSIFADIAYRMAMLNLALGDCVLETPGVVMIDEIDLHLHPPLTGANFGGSCPHFPQRVVYCDHAFTGCRGVGTLLQYSRS